MKITVVMTTYNGEKYIYDQLRSIYDQTRKPDEVIICDDRSADQTVNIIRDFITCNHLNNWNLIVNSVNKGWQRNFIEALERSSGDYIFFSDQDDVWFEDKIEIMMQYMERTSQIQCLSGKMVTIDGDGMVFKGKNVFSSGEDTNILDKYIFSENFNTNTILGCVMCITKQLADIIIQMNVKDYGHDAQCCRLGLVLDGAYVLDRPVIKYRLHNNNTSGVVSGVSFGSATLQKRICDIEKNINWLQTLLNFLTESEFIDRKKIEVIKKTIIFQKERRKFLMRKNILLYVKLFKYRHYYSGLPMYAGDFMYAFHINKLAGKILWMLRKRKKL